MSQPAVDIYYSLYGTILNAVTAPKGEKKRQREREKVIQLEEVKKKVREEEEAKGEAKRLALTIESLRFQKINRATSVFLLSPFLPLLQFSTYSSPISFSSVPWSQAKGQSTFFLSATLLHLLIKDTHRCIYIVAHPLSLACCFIHTGAHKFQLTHRHTPLLPFSSSLSN